VPCEDAGALTSKCERVVVLDRARLVSFWPGLPVVHFRKSLL